MQKAHGFRLPDNPRTPIVMIGPGTGVAPFRAFLQEREAIGAPGRNWLFFGHQRREHDFFYEDEFEAMRKSGALTRLSLAWSRDGDESSTSRIACARSVGAVALARQGRACLCLRRRQTHGEGRRPRAGRHRRRARRALDRGCGELRRRPEEAGRYQADVY